MRQRAVSADEITLALVDPSPIAAVGTLTVNHLGHPLVAAVEHVHARVRSTA